MNSPVSVSVILRRLGGPALLALALLLGPGATDASAASRAEQREYDAALALFQDRLHGPAERAFAELINRHPGTTLRPQAVLYLAQSRLHQANYTGAVQLLAREQEQAGAIADQYRFFIGEAQMGQELFREAAATFASVRETFPDTPFLLETFQRQAAALGAAGDWTAVSALLLEPGGPFLAAFDTSPATTPVIGGMLLAAEAELNNGRPLAAAELLERLTAPGTRPEFRWKRQFLLARAQADVGTSQNLLEMATNLVAGARSLGSPEALAEARLFHGRLLGQGGFKAEAAAVWEEMLGAVTGPAEPRRRALDALVGQMLERREFDAALDRLRRFQTAFTNDPAANAAQLATAEILLRQSDLLSRTNPPAAEALRLSALTNLQSVINRPASPVLIGRAWLQMGWIHWLRTNWTEARAAFGQAADLLPPSPEAAVALFKSGDSELALGRPHVALEIYRALGERLEQRPDLAPGLAVELEFQRLRAALNSGNHAEAERAVTRLAAGYPGNVLTARATVLLGVDFSRSGRPADAKRLMRDFLTQHPDSPLREQAELVIARSEDLEGNWAAAAETYGRWLEQHPANPLRAKVAFLRADATHRMGDVTNAVAQFATLAADLSAGEESFLAENWLGDHHWNRQDYAQAQRHFQRLYERAGAPKELAYQARMMAGKAAFASQDFREARSQFTALVNLLQQDTAAPAGLLPNALFALGDTFFRELLVSTNQPQADFDNAVGAFNRITTLFGDTPVGARAWGRLGEVYHQWGALKADPASFANAERALLQALNSPKADAETKQLALLALGQLREAEKKPTEALDLYLKLVYHAGDTPTEPDLLKRAGLNAARLLEANGDWVALERIYLRLANLAPALGPVLTPRLETVRLRINGGQR